jgi:hypothetical protein
MDDAQKLLIERACQRLVFEFALHADRGDYDKLGRLFAADGRFTRRGETFRGPAAIADSVDQLLQNWRSAPKRPTWRVRHFCSNVLIDVRSAESALGSAYYTIYRYQGGPVDGVPPITGPALIGDYADEFTLTPDGWRFASREVQPAFFNPGA